MTPRAIGIDPGGARVGLAISDELGLLAHPLGTIEIRLLTPTAGAAKAGKTSLRRNAGGMPAPGRECHDRLAERIADIANQRGVTTLVVGLPLNMDGTAGPSAEKARQLAAALRTAGAFEVIEWDERMTTQAAHRQFREAGRSQKEARGKIDQAAAQILLQSWLDSRQLMRSWSC